MRQADKFKFEWKDDCWMINNHPSIIFIKKINDIVEEILFLPETQEFLRLQEELISASSYFLPDIVKSWLEFYIDYLDCFIYNYYYKNTANDMETSIKKEKVKYKEADDKSNLFLKKIKAI